jgi:hypothetical protein
MLFGDQSLSRKTPSSESDKQPWQPKNWCFDEDSETTRQLENMIKNKSESRSFDLNQKSIQNYQMLPPLNLRLSERDNEDDYDDETKVNSFNSYNQKNQNNNHQPLLKTITTPNSIPNTKSPRSQQQHKYHHPRSPRVNRLQSSLSPLESAKKNREMAENARKSVSIIRDQNAHILSEVYEGMEAARVIDDRIRIERQAAAKAVVSPNSNDGAAEDVNKAAEELKQLELEAKKVSQTMVKCDDLLRQQTLKNEERLRDIKNEANKLQSQAEAEIANALLLSEKKMIQASQEAVKANKLATRLRNEIKAALELEELSIQQAKEAEIEAELARQEEARLSELRVNQSLEDWAMLYQGGGGGGGDGIPMMMMTTNVSASSTPFTSPGPSYKHHTSFSSFKESNTPGGGGYATPSNVSSFNETEGGGGEMKENNVYQSGNQILNEIESRRRRSIPDVLEDKIKLLELKISQLSSQVQQQDQPLPSNQSSLSSNFTVPGNDQTINNRSIKLNDTTTSSLPQIEKSPPFSLSETSNSDATNVKNRKKSMHEELIETKQEQWEKALSGDNDKVENNEDEDGMKSVEGRTLTHYDKMEGHLVHDITQQRQNNKPNHRLSVTEIIDEGLEAWEVHFKSKMKRFSELALKENKKLGKLGSMDEYEHVPAPGIAVVASKAIAAVAAAAQDEDAKNNSHVEVQEEGQLKNGMEQEFQLEADIVASTSSPSPAPSSTNPINDIPVKENEEKKEVASEVVTKDLATLSGDGVEDEDVLFNKPGVLNESNVIPLPQSPSNGGESVVVHSTPVASRTPTDAPTYTMLDNKAVENELNKIPEPSDEPPLVVTTPSPPPSSSSPPPLKSSLSRKWSITEKVAQLGAMLKLPTSPTTSPSLKPNLLNYDPETGYYEILYETQKLGLGLHAALDHRDLPIVTSIKSKTKHRPYGDRLSMVNGKSLIGEDDTYEAALSWIKSSDRPLTLGFVPLNTVIKKQFEASLSLDTQGSVIVPDPSGPPPAHLVPQEVNQAALSIQRFYRKSVEKVAVPDADDNQDDTSDITERGVLMDNLVLVNESALPEQSEQSLTLTTNDKDKESEEAAAPDKVEQNDDAKEDKAVPERRPSGMSAVFGEELEEWEVKLKEKKLTKDGDAAEDEAAPDKVEHNDDAKEDEAVPERRPSGMSAVFGEELEEWEVKLKEKELTKDGDAPEVEEVNRGSMLKDVFNVDKEAWELKPAKSIDKPTLSFESINKRKSYIDIVKAYERHGGKDEWHQELIDNSSSPSTDKAFSIEQLNEEEEEKQAAAPDKVEQNDDAKEDDDIDVKKEEEEEVAMKSVRKPKLAFLKELRLFKFSTKNFWSPQKKNNNETNGEDDIKDDKDMIKQEPIVEDQKVDQEYKQDEVFKVEEVNKQQSLLKDTQSLNNTSDQSSLNSPVVSSSPSNTNPPLFTPQPSSSQQEQLSTSQNSINHRYTPTTAQILSQSVPASVGDIKNSSPLPIQSQQQNQLMSQSQTLNRQDFRSQIRMNLTSSPTSSSLGQTSPMPHGRSRRLAPLEREHQIRTNIKTNAREWLKAAPLIRNDNTTLGTSGVAAGDSGANVTIASFSSPLLN